MAFEDEVANSLLGPEAEAAEEAPVSEYSAHGDELLSQEIAERAENVFRDGDAEVQSQRETRGGSSTQEQENSKETTFRGREEALQPSQEQAVELTAEQVETGIAELEQAVEANGLNDPQTAKEFATDFCGAFGSDPYKAGVDVQTLGSTMAKATLSACTVYQQLGGDLANLPEMPAASARAFTHDILKGLGFDPREVPVDERLLADTVMRSTLNFIDTYSKYGGKVTDMGKLNDPQMAEWLLGNWLKAFGVDRQVTRQEALRFADAGGKYILSFLGKLGQINQRAAQARQGQGSRTNTGRGRGQRVPAKFREGIRGRKVQTFRSNADIFSPSIMEGIAMDRL